ncbi:MAG TPA: carboxyl transferase domain-containing protein [Streptosporangiaceae bacterium]|nr:carboxyl transferase domain-containing protein [Streptosporangiaceae bacterium]
MKEAAIPLYAAIADPGSLTPFGAEFEPGNPSAWPGYAVELSRARRATGARHAVTTGFATIGGERCVLIGFEFAFLGGSMGTAEGARISRAFTTAIGERLPVVCIAASGGARLQEGASALLQMQGVAAAVAAARQAGIPFAAVAGDPTTGGVWASLVAAADVVIGVDRARISFSGSRTRPADAADDSPEYHAAAKWQHGYLDVLAPADQVAGRLAAFISLLAPGSRGSGERLDPALPGPAARAAEVRPASPAWRSGSAAGSRDGRSRDGWSQVTATRRAGRARADRWLAWYFDRCFEIRGDRCGGVDRGLRCGFGSRNGQTIGYIAQSGQATTAAGYRTAIRLMGLAERFGRPVLTLVDTPGAAAAPDDERAGIGTAIAESLVAMATSRVPVTTVVIGEGVSGGALAIASPADLWISRDAYLSVTSPEFAVSILKREEADIAQVAGLLRLTPADLARRGLVRGILAPPGDDV